MQAASGVKQPVCRVGALLRRSACGACRPRLPRFRSGQQAAFTQVADRIRIDVATAFCTMLVRAEIRRRPILPIGTPAVLPSTRPMMIGPVARDGFSGR